MAPTDPGIVVSVGQLVTLGVSIGGVITAGAFGVLKWSLGRNMAAMDAKFGDLSSDIKALSAKFDTLYQRQEALQREAITRVDCNSCRKDCQDKNSQYQREILEWMRRQDDKLDNWMARQDDKSDKILMMMANVNNGQGGLK